MNAKEFKDRVCYWLEQARADSATSAEDDQEIVNLKGMVDMIGADVIVKTDHGNHFQEEVSLNGLINLLSAGYTVINIQDV